MGDLPNGEFSAAMLHSNILEEVLGSGGSNSLLHSYQRSFNGFAAKLTKDEAQKLANTGIWPESESFNDEGFGPPPKKWKGTCQESSNFTCNNKIIGARYYRANRNFGQNDIQSPRDSDGHGTHTSSTAAGALVSKASLFGLASGTARGGVPSARIAVYKICWSDGCPDEDILAAFDDAIADGVDIISLSVGWLFAKDYFNDTIAIGAFHSMKSGILTSNFAGNEGPNLATVTNVSPWNCLEDSLDKTLVAGKIILCDEVSDGEGASAAGDVGAVMKDYLDSAFNFPLPVSCLGLDDGSEVSNYLELNKPDLTAPGVDILAAWSQGTTITGLEGDNRVVPYNMLSGTSMSCPHATAAAAYIKSFNPTWSPAAIKSALMTTAIPLSLETNTDAEFAFGSGHLIPSFTLNPGLVYDAGEIDYIKFLCGQGYSTRTLRLVTGDRSSCSEATNGTAWDLNYPSFALSASPGKSTRRIFHRTVTNVGSAVSI
ncbi:hypothetical protein CRYUN_Cryun01aG0037700 [Craigia yunnanensis]